MMIYDDHVGINNTGGTLGIVKNNIFASTTTPVYGTFSAGTDYNSTASTSIGYTVTGGGNIHDRVSQSFSFLNVASGDFHLGSSDTGAKDQGENLSSDAGLPIDTDIDGQSRPYGAAFDIGADEYVPSGDIVPPVISAVATSAISYSEATISWTTDENSSSTVSYGTTISYGNASTSAIFSTFHTIILSSLLPDTTYHFQISNADISGNIATSSDLIFTTSAAGVVNSASCSESDVSAAQAIASSGDTIEIPAGTCTWSSALQITKSVVFKGQSDNGTIINDYGFSTSGSPPVNDWRVTEVTFSNVDALSGGSSVGISFQLHGDDNFIIDNNSFLGYGAGAIVTNGSKGLIANNLFVSGNNTDALIYVNGQNRGNEEWADPSYFGQSGNFVFIEDNEFRCDASSTSCQHALMGQWGGSLVARCNLVDDSTSSQSASWTNPFDMHNYGLAGASTNGAQRAAKEAEIYGNKFVPKSSYPFDSVWIRGGSARIFNNLWDLVDSAFTRYSGGAIYFREYRATANDDKQYPITTINGIYACAGPVVGQCTLDSAGSCIVDHEGILVVTRSVPARISQMVLV